MLGSQKNTNRATSSRPPSAGSSQRFSPDVAVAAGLTPAFFCWVSGAAADAGWFTTYEKAYPSLGIQAVIEFTGNPLPEEERDVALLALYFTRAVEPGGFGAPAADLQLGDIPRVLLDECRSDYATVAAEGPGFAADWEKQSSY